MVEGGKTDHDVKMAQNSDFGAHKENTIGMGPCTVVMYCFHGYSVLQQGRVSGWGPYVPLRQKYLLSTLEEKAPLLSEPVTVLCV